MITQQERVINNFRKYSDHYHRLSFLFYELANSLERFNNKEQSMKKFREEIKKLNLDIDKILRLSVLDKIKLKDIQR